MSIIPHNIKQRTKSLRPNTRELVREMQREVTLLRSFVIGAAGKDPEGAYRPEFVERIFRAMQEPASHTFRNSESFLAQLKRHTA